MLGCIRDYRITWDEDEEDMSLHVYEDFSLAPTSSAEMLTCSCDVFFGKHKQ
jgi:hypothetical protein